MPFFEVALVTLGEGGEAEGALFVAARAKIEMAEAVEGVMSPIPLGWV